MFYVLFGLCFSPSRSGGTNLASYLIATYGAFGVTGTSLFGFGVGVASERGQVKRTIPMPPSPYLIAKIAMSMLFSLMLILLLFTMGIVFGK